MKKVRLTQRGWLRMRMIRFQEDKDKAEDEAKDEAEDESEVTCQVT